MLLRPDCADSACEDVHKRYDTAWDTALLFKSLLLFRTRSSPQSFAVATTYPDATLNCLTAPLTISSTMTLAGRISCTIAATCSHHQLRSHRHRKGTNVPGP